MTPLKFLGLGLAANAIVAVPYYLLIEKRAVRDQDPATQETSLYHAKLGTVALSVVPWLYVASRVAILGSALLDTRKTDQP